MQENKQEKSPIKQNILLYLEKKGITQYEFYKLTGVTRGVLGQNNGISEENLSRFLAYFKDINITWLITGEGPMLKEDKVSQVNPTHFGSETTTDCCSFSDSSPRSSIYDKVFDKPEAIPFAEAARNGLHPIPLVTQKAAAGFGSGDFSIEEADVKEYYVIPKFKYCHVDFMIEVSGLSMYPHFNPRDVIACSILRNSQFLQWNKCHVIATREQGILVKRLMPGEDKKHLRAISDNKEYPPFEIPVDEITGIAVVVGHVGLE